jgi:hypothetical protein
VALAGREPPGHPGPVSMTRRRSTAACPSMYHVSSSSVITARTATVAPRDADPPYNYAIGRASVFDAVDEWGRASLPASDPPANW